MKVKISISAKKLPNVAGFLDGTSDPFAVIAIMSTEKGSQPKIIGQTEVITNTVSPQWNKFFILDYEPGTPLHIAISVVDEVQKSVNKPMANGIFEVGKALRKKGGTLSKKVKGKGSLSVTVTEMKKSGLLKLQLVGQKLANTEPGFGVFDKSDPFFEVCRKVDGSNPDKTTWNNVFRSGVVMNNLEPDWKETRIDLDILCGGDLDKPIKIIVQDYEKDGKHDLIGSYETTVNDLLTQPCFEITKKNLVKKDKFRGTIVILKAEIISGDLEEKMDAASLNQNRTVPNWPYFIRKEPTSPPPAAAPAPGVTGSDVAEALAGAALVTAVVAGTIAAPVVTWLFIGLVIASNDDDDNSDSSVSSSSSSSS